MSIKLKNENKLLKERVLALENENMRLLRFIKGDNSDALCYFSSRGDKGMLN